MILPVEVVEETCHDTPETKRDCKERFANKITYSLKQEITIYNDIDDITRGSAVSFQLGKTVLRTNIQTNRPKYRRTDSELKNAGKEGYKTKTETLRVEQIACI